ncbi:MAG: hypothetical protein EP330_19075 [Deltaproteobacteria bacterium]|nr:MAG: hypothetical protein EP330_19075 [Deltaproteobacteria bacterium]
MHRTTVLALAVFATACSGRGVVLEHEGSVWTSARGVAIQDDGERVHMGMDWGTTCAFDLVGDFQEDYDFPTETDAIHDARFGAAVGSSSEGLHFIGHDLGDVPMPGVISAALTEGGAVALTEFGGRCELQFVGGEGVTAVALGEDCGGTEIDALGGAAVVGAASGARLVTADGEVALPGAELVVANRVSNLVYSAAYWGDTLYAAAADGSPLWEVDVDGRLIDIDDMGAAGLVVASVQRAHEGGILFLDATTGELVDELPVPSAEEIATSEDGETLAVVTEWETRLYSVEHEGAKARFYATAAAAGLTPQTVGD